MSSQESDVSLLIQMIRERPSRVRYSLIIHNVHTTLIYDILNQSCSRLGQKMLWSKRGGVNIDISGCIVTTDNHIFFLTDIVSTSRYVKLRNITFYSDNPSHLDVIRQIYYDSRLSTLPSVVAIPIIDTSSNTTWIGINAHVPSSPDPNIQPYLHIYNTSKHECPECHSSLISKTRTYYSKSGDILFWDACCSSGHYIVIENK